MRTIVEFILVFFALHGAADYLKLNRLSDVGEYVVLTLIAVLFFRLLYYLKSEAEDNASFWK